MSTTSHTSHHDTMALFIPPHCLSRLITGPLTCSQSSHQPSPTELATPTTSTKMNLASNNWARPPATQSRPHLVVVVSAGLFTVVLPYGDGYVLLRTHHLMMMMTMINAQCTLYRVEQKYCFWKFKFCIWWHMKGIWNNAGNIQNTATVKPLW